MLEHSKTSKSACENTVFTTPAALLDAFAKTNRYNKVELKKFLSGSEAAEGFGEQL